MMMQRLAKLQEKRASGKWLNPWEMLQVIATIAVLTVVALYVFFGQTVQSEVQSLGKNSGLADKDELESLRERVEQLEAQLPHSGS